jgi:hypothetical protein
MPDIEEDLPWHRLIDTYEASASKDEFSQGSVYDVRPCSMAVFRMGAEEE